MADATKNADNDKQFKEAIDNKYVSRVSLSDSFTTNEQVIRNMLSDKSGISSDGGGISDSDISAIIDSLPAFMKKGKKRDTQLGGNNAINCYYQFNENDDVIHPINKTAADDGSGMGRVYSETFDDQQQIVYLSFGVPDYTNMSKFLDKTYNTDLATLMNSGESKPLVTQITTFLGSVVGSAVLWPIYPIKWALDFFGSDATPSKYYDFKPTMALYYRAVNVIIAHLASNMNLLDENMAPVGGSPEILKKHGLDILSILSRKHWYDNLRDAKSPTADDMLKKMINDPMYEMGLWGGLKEGLAAGLTESMLYVGFKVEKSTGSNETATNSTKEPDIVNMINGRVSEAQTRTFNLAAVKETAVGGAINDVYSAIGGFFSGATKGLNIQGGIEVLKGSGFVDIPEIWASSSFQKHYTFDFQLRTPYGDPFSIFYSLYVPLAMLIAGAFPRSVGQNAYTAPFLVRAYCQGMFAIPLGMIDSISITRGASEYGWADGMLPTQIDVSITIKDLSPLMHIAIADGGIKDWMSILGQNSTFQEYMLTLAGVNIAQRHLLKEQFGKRKAALTKILSNNKLNPMMFGFSLTETKLGRVFTKLNPISRLPGSTPSIKG